ncbi:MAG: AtpZ/AtpI family protein [Bacillota bacterium]
MGALKQVGRYLSLLFHIGILIVASIYIGFLGGSWLDDYLGAGMSFTVVGVILGVASGFWGSYRVMMSVSDRSEDGDDGLGDG